MVKYVYSFGNNQTDGDASMKNELGGKGANLCEMVKLGIPIPPGFVIGTECCAAVSATGKYPDEVKTAVDAAILVTEKSVGRKFGDKNDPLLLSVRSGAAVSLPGMMDTVLNLGLNDETVKTQVAKGGDVHFVWDSYRRFIAMFSNVVQQLDMHPFEHVLEQTKVRLNKEKPLAGGIKYADKDIPVAEVERVVGEYKKLYKQQSGKDFPQDPRFQLWESINAVFRSWDNARAVKYREMNNIRGLIGTAVTVQTMVFGNRDNNSATGVAFSRNPSNGDPFLYGEYLLNAQGEDVVAGIRTPQQVTKRGSLEWAKRMGVSEADRASKFPSMEESLPKQHAELMKITDTLEHRFKDLQDMEFTIEQGKLWFLQTRNGKRTAAASVAIAVDLVKEGVIDAEEALMRIDPNDVNKLLLPSFDPAAARTMLARGLPASPGAAVGQIVFNAEDALAWKEQGKKCIMVRMETSPEDLVGMDAAEGILTARGGMTSHAAVVARGMGKTCVSGCGDLEVRGKTATLAGKALKEGDWISLDGTLGEVLDGKVALVRPNTEDGPFHQIMVWANQFRKLGVRANADTPKDAAVAVGFGAEGIGLCRTEHMFFEGDRVDAVRAMMLATDKGERMAALEQIKPYQKADFKGLFVAMAGRPCTIRLLDPPMHEFVPHEAKEQAALAPKTGKTAEWIANRVKSLEESNPMLGHRGVRLGLVYPEIYEAQVEALFDAATELEKETGKSIKPEVMIPLVGKVDELRIMKEKCVAVADRILKERGSNMKYSMGTMIEVPRAALTANEVAHEAEFFSFGTNDLTQMGCGFSRDDSGAFLKEYVKLGIYDADPFQVLDQEGVGLLVQMAVQKGRATRPDLKCGICGEHGGEPKSVKFCHRVGLDYVSCSPYRVPIAIIAAGQAAVEEKRSGVPAASRAAAAAPKSKL